MELKRYIDVIWKWAWMILLATGLAAGLSYLATIRQPKLYQASTRALVGQAVRAANPDPQEFQTSTALALTYIEIAKTTPVLQGTLDALKLKMTPDTLRERFRASLIPGTQLIEFRLDDTDPERAQLLANELAFQLTLQGPAAQQDPQQIEFIRKQTDDLQAKITDAQKKIAELRALIQASAGARENAARQQEITTLETQIAQWRANYTDMSRLLAPRSPNTISIVEPAQLPTKPYAPNVLLNVVLAAAVGLILSIGATVLIEYLDDTIKHPDDVDHILGLPVLGTLANLSAPKVGALARLFGGMQKPKTKSPARNGSARHSRDLPPEKIEPVDHVGVLDEKLITALTARSADAEAYRVLRTNIQFNGVDEPIKSILVTSASMGEGKSMTTANLAIVMAQAGLRTVLLDCDLRKPSQHHWFGLINDVGLTDSLMAQANADGFLRPTPVENLCVLTTGALPPNPAELLGSQRMRALKKRLEGNADILIVDGPPVLPVADAAILANLVDGVIMVVDVTQTHRKEATRAKDMLVKVGARILGVALNRVQPRTSDYYYYYDYTPHTGATKHKPKSHAAVKNAKAL